MIGWIVAIVAALIAAFVYWTRSRTGRKPFVHAEYWVYLPGEILPPQDAILTKVMRENRHRPQGRSPITPAEGLLFSDVRLHIALVKRSRNPHVFRPDLFDVTVEPTAETLEALSKAQSFAKVRFLSEVPIADRRHLQLLPHVAGTIADLAGATVIYDTIEERLTLPESFHELLSNTADLTTPDVHTRVLWKRLPVGGQVETRGLVKAGLPEVVTEELNDDQRVLAIALVEAAVRSVYALSSLPPFVDVNYFDDDYRVSFTVPRKGPAKAQLLKLPRSI